MKEETAEIVNEYFTTGWIVCYVLFPPLLVFAALICVWHMLVDR